MKLLFLGTGAADWKPIHAGNPEYRRNSSALLDGELLIDPGPCVPEAAKTFGVDLSRMRYVITTHSHADHFCPETAAALQALGAECISFAPGETKILGRYTVEAVRANHGTARDAVHYLIDDGERRLFYGLDGAWLLYDEVAAIRQKRVDLFVLDGTVGDRPGDYRIFEHNDLAMVEEMKKTLSAYGDRFMISHMARTLHTDHATLCARMAASGIGVAYDGLEVSL